MSNYTTREQQVLQHALTYGNIAHELNQARIAVSDACDASADDAEIDRLEEHLRNLELNIETAEYQLRLSAGLLAMEKRVARRKEQENEL